MIGKIPRTIIFGNKATTRWLPESGTIDGIAQKLIESEAAGIARLTGGVVSQRSNANATIEVPYKGGKAYVYLCHVIQSVNRPDGITQEGAINVSADYAVGKTLGLTGKLLTQGYSVPIV